MAKVGRPTDYTQEKAEDLCVWLANGKTLNKWCELQGVNASTVWRWQQAHPEFRNAIARAREAQAFYWANQIIELSDDSEDDYMEVPVGDPEKGRTKTVFDREHYERVRLRIQTRQWLMARYSPELFGDRVEVTHEDGEAKRNLEELKSRALERARQLGLPAPDFAAILGRRA